jgi:hypothetical protein
MITVGTKAQYARCSLEHEIFVNRSMFPSVPEGITQASPFNLAVLMATEQAKSTDLAQRLKEQYQRQRQLQDASEEPDMPDAVQEDWEEVYHTDLTEQMTAAGLSTSQIHFLIMRYGEYFIRLREQYDGQPTFLDLKSE